MRLSSNGNPPGAGAGGGAVFPSLLYPAGSPPEPQPNRRWKSTRSTNASRTYIRRPIQFRRVERIVLFTDHEGQPIDRRPTHERTADVNTVIVRTSRIGGVGRRTVAIVRGRQLEPTKEIVRQLEICV